MQTYTSKHTLCPEACFPRTEQSPHHVRLGTCQLCDTIPGTSTVEKTSAPHCGISSSSELLSLQPNTQALPSSQGWGTRLRSAKIISHTVFYSFSDAVLASVHPSIRPFLIATLTGERGRKGLFQGQSKVKRKPSSSLCLGSAIRWWNPLVCRPHFIKGMYLNHVSFPKSNSICLRFFPSSSSDALRCSPMPPPRVSPQFYKRQSATLHACCDSHNPHTSTVNSL